MKLPSLSPLGVSKDYIKIEHRVTRRNQVTIDEQVNRKDQRIVELREQDRRYFSIMKYNSPKRYQEVLDLGDGDLKIGSIKYEELELKVWIDVVDLLSSMEPKELRKLELKAGLCKNYLSIFYIKWNNKKFTDHRSFTTARRILEKAEQDD